MSGSIGKNLMRQAIFTSGSEVKKQSDSTGKSDAVKGLEALYTKAGVVDKGLAAVVMSKLVGKIERDMGKWIGSKKYAQDDLKLVLSELRDSMKSAGIELDPKVKEKIDKLTGTHSDRADYGMTANPVFETGTAGKTIVVKGFAVPVEPNTEDGYEAPLGHSIDPRRGSYEIEPLYDAPGHGEKPLQWGRSGSHLDGSGGQTPYSELGPHQVHTEETDVASRQKTIVVKGFAVPVEPNREDGYEAPLGHSIDPRRDSGGRESEYDTPDHRETPLQWGRSGSRLGGSGGQTPYSELGPHQVHAEEPPYVFHKPRNTPAQPAEKGAEYINWTRLPGVPDEEA